MNSNNKARLVTPSDLPAPADAVQLYQQHGQLTEPYDVGSDPLIGDTNKIQLRKEAFVQQYPSFKTIFSKLVNGDSSSFKLGLKFFINITRRLALSC